MCWLITCECGEFISLLGGAAASLCVAVRGALIADSQVWRIGVLETVPTDLNVANFDALRRGLRELGYVEERNYLIEYRSADGRAERFAGLAAELVALTPT